MPGHERVHIGTSGWHYRHWEGPFYPEGLSTSDYLSFYIQYFRTVEINNSFYRLPEAETFNQWREAVPPRFLFAVKANRYITHMKKLKDPQEPVSNFMERVEKLEDKLGPILFQLPPRWRVNLERLTAFLDLLPRYHRYAFEFRDPSWFERRVYEALAKYGAAFCIYELNGQLSPKEVTADFVYVRLHGPRGAYQGLYGAEGLADWAQDFSRWSKEGKAIFCYFDNDQAGYAPKDALTLQEMLSNND